MNIVTRQEAKLAGEKFYFTGKPCRRGHVKERYTSSCTCVECEAIKSKKYRKNNREKLVAQSRKYRVDNREKILAWQKKYREDNPEKIAAQQKKYCEDNHEKVAAQKKEYHNANREKIASWNKEYRDVNREKIAVNRKKWRANNPEKLAVSKKKYNENNPHKVSAYTAKRRAAKLNATPEWLTELDEFVITEIYGLAQIKSTSTGVKHHVDHVIPLQGENVCGLHVPWNLSVITATENRIKGNTL